MGAIVIMEAIIFLFVI